MSKLALGLDIGGTKIEAALVDINGGILDKMRIKTERDKGYDHVMNRLAALIEALLSRHGTRIEKLLGIGAGLPGSVSPESGKMLNGNSSIFIDRDFKQDLINLLGTDLPVATANDANCFALAETLWGAGKEHAKKCGREVDELTAVGIILGTGCGGGLIINGRTYEGSHGAGAEVGHILLGDEKLECYCNKIDCAELYLSGTGLESAYQRKSGFHKSGMEIFSCEGEDDYAAEVINDYQHLLAIHLGNLANLFDPDFFVLGGGVSLQKRIYLGMESLLKHQCFLKDFPPALYQHSLGDSAGVIGAASLVLPQNKDALP